MDFIHKFTPGRVPVTVLLLHGSGGDENDLLPIGAALAPGAAYGGAKRWAPAAFAPRKDQRT